MWSLLVVVVLCWAGAVKLFSAHTPSTARRSALRRLVGQDRVVGAYRAVGVVELTVAAGVLLPPTTSVASVAAVVLFAGMLGYLGYAAVVAPDSSCGCLGSATAPVSWRSFVRAAVLLVAAGVALVAAPWPDALADSPEWTTIGLLAGLAVVVASSPELDRRWLFPLRRLRLRLFHPLAGHEFNVPVASTVTQLQRSPAYLSVVGQLRSDLLDVWEEGDWRVLTYAAHDGRTVVFAVPLLRYDPAAVRVVVVAEPEPELTGSR